MVICLLLLSDLIPFFMIIRKSNQSNKLLVFHLDLHVWSTIDVKGFVPRGRAFHSAVLIGDYMIIYGKRN